MLRRLVKLRRLLILGTLRRLFSRKILHGDLDHSLPTLGCLSFRINPLKGGCREEARSGCSWLNVYFCTCIRRVALRWALERNDSDQSGKLRSSCTFVSHDCRWKDFGPARNFGKCGTRRRCKSFDERRLRNWPAWRKYRIRHMGRGDLQRPLAGVQAIKRSNTDHGLPIT
jgi:hypothetical protein